MSPRAACRLEALGFSEVYDYVPGKADWLARGLPTEGEKAGEARAGDAVRDDVVTCGVAERIGAVRASVESSPYGFALVVAERRILLGRLRRAALEGDPDRRAGEAMEPGPSTVRMDTALDSLAGRLDQGGYKTAIVTRPEGVLVGIVRREDLPGS